LVQTFEVSIIDMKSVMLRGLSFKDISHHVDRAAPEIKLGVEDAEAVAESNKSSSVVRRCRYDPMSIWKGDSNW